jgi:CrcB protein
MLGHLISVAIGGAVGASLRYLTGLATIRLIGPGYPWGTITVNIVGSFVMGVIVVLLAAKSETRLAPLLMTGVLGGFTTFSAFSLDFATMWERGDTNAAMLYLTASVVLSIAALFGGLATARSIFL